jgi:hypothetical protein
MLEQVLIAEVAEPLCVLHPLPGAIALMGIPSDLGRSTSRHIGQTRVKESVNESSVTSVWAYVKERVNESI